MLKKFFFFLMLVAGIGAFIYFVPQTWKQRGAAMIYESNLLPQPVRDVVKTGEYLLNDPVKSRENIIKKLEEQLEKIKQALEEMPEAASEPVSRLVDDSKAAIEELKTQNQDSPLTSIVAGKIADAVAEYLKSDNNGGDAKCQ